MKKIKMASMLAAVVLLFGLNAMAQVKRVQMHIGGYLCGN